MANWSDCRAGKRRAWRPSPAFLRRRLSEAVGFVLFLAALVLAVALASYDHEDPSWNHAVDAPIHNWIGPYGATIADVFCQSLGAAPLILPIVLFAWSFRLLLNRGVGALWLRLALLPPAIVLAATALALIPRPPRWLPRGEHGGTLGKFLPTSIAGVLHLTAPMIAMPAAALVGLPRPFILGLSRRAWLLVGEG